MKKLEEHCIKMKDVKNHKEAMSVFLEFCKNLKEAQIDCDYDDLLKLMNSKDFYHVIDIIFKRYERQIRSGFADRIFFNKMLITALEIYCMINDINTDDYENDQFSKNNINMDNLYFQEVGIRPLLSPKESRELIIRAQNGDKFAKELFVECNLKLVISIANRKTGRGLPLLDLIQEGSMGLLVALERFDVNLGYRFSTYATHWIKQAIERALDRQARTIRLPGYVEERMRRTKRVYSELNGKLKRTPTYEELAEATGYSKEAVERYLNMTVDVASFDKLLTDDDDVSLDHFIGDDKENPEDEMIQSVFRKGVADYLADCGIPLKYIEIIKLRYGFYNNYEYTLDSIGEIYGVTRERVRQIVEKTLELFRNDPTLIKFVDYCNFSIDDKKKVTESILGNKLRKQVEKRSYKGRDKNDVRVLTDGLLFGILEQYDSKTINEMMNMLSDSDTGILRLCFGEDLKNPHFCYVTDVIQKKLEEYLIPKITRLLSEVDQKQLKKYKKY